MPINPRPLPPPLLERLIDENGLVTPAWANFFTMVYRFQKNQDEAAADGTYTLGTGVTNGEITLLNGVITTIQEVS